jgi:hypothetical protein
MGYTFLPCRHCGGERDTCPRCGYLCCDCEPCACQRGRASTAALKEKEMAFYDEHCCSEQELARRQFQELVHTPKARGVNQDSKQSRSRGAAVRVHFQRDVRGAGGSEPRSFHGHLVVLREDERRFESLPRGTVQEHRHGALRALDGPGVSEGLRDGDLHPAEILLHPTSASLDLRLKARPLDVHDALARGEERRVAWMRPSSVSSG